MPANPPADPVIVPPHTDVDRPFLERMAHRPTPGNSAWPRDPDDMARFFDNLSDNLLTTPDAEAFIAELDVDPAGVLNVHPDTDYLTGHPRARVDILVVAPEAEGRGVGRALLEQVERWARERGCLEFESPPQHSQVSRDGPKSLSPGSTGRVPSGRRLG